MITVRHIENTIAKREVEAAFREEWRGQRVSELAPKGATACIVDGALVRCVDPGWNAVVHDGSILIYVKTSHELTTIAFIVQVLILAVSLISTGFAVYSFFSAPSGQNLAKSSKSNDRDRESGTYGFDEIQNRTENGSPVAVVYGEHDVGGQIIMAYRRAFNGSHTLFMLIALSEGPIQAIGQYTTNQDGLGPNNMIEGMKINGCEAKEFRHIKASLRLGGGTQTPMEHFHEIVGEYDHEYELNGEREFVWIGRDPANRFFANIIFPQGLYEFGSTGKLKNMTVKIRMEVRDPDTNNIVGAVTASISKKTQQPYYYTLIHPLNIPPKIGYKVKVFRVSPIPPEFREKTTVQDKCVLISINEVQSLAPAYPFRALIGLQMQATDQLSGATPRVIIPIKGRKVRTSFESETEEFSSNPAHVLRDALTHRRYGLGNKIPDIVPDQQSFEDFEDECAEMIPVYTGSPDDEVRYRFDGVFDVARPAWEEMLKIAATARATLIKVGDLVKVKLEKQKPALQTFSMANMIEGTFEVSYHNPAERPNVIQCQFRNRDRHFHQDQINAETPGLSESLDSIRRVTLPMYGITRPTQCRRIAYYHLRHNSATLKSVKFDCALEALAVEPGDVIQVAHDAPRWSASGRLSGVDSETGHVRLDRAVVFQPGVVYAYLEIDPEDEEKLTQDFTVEEEIETDTLAFAPLHGEEGAHGRAYIVGRKRHLAEEFMVMNVTDTDNLAVKRIEAINYDPEVFTDEAEPFFDDIFEGDPGDAPDPVENIAIAESCDHHGNSLLEISWDPSEGAATYIIMARGAGLEGVQDFEQLAQTESASATVSLPYALGTALEIAILAVSADGTAQEPEDAPSVVYVITRETDSCDLIEFPGDVENLQWTQIDNNLYELSWDAVPDADGYEVREGNWHEGIRVYAGATASVQIKCSNLERQFNVRARIGDYFSPANGIAYSPIEPNPAYPTLALAPTNQRLTDGMRANMTVIPWHRLEREALVQLIPDAQISYETPLFDLGSVAPTHASLDWRAISYHPSSPAELDLYSSMKQWSFAGEINKRYLVNQELKILYSTDGANFAFIDAKASLESGQEMFANARYFKAQWKAQAARFGDLAIIQAGGALERLRLAFHRS